MRLVRPSTARIRRRVTSSGWPRPSMADSRSRPGPRRSAARSARRRGLQPVADRLFGVVVRWTTSPPRSSRRQVVAGRRRPGRVVGGAVRHTRRLRDAVDDHVLGHLEVEHEVQRLADVGGDSLASADACPTVGEPVEDVAPVGGVLPRRSARGRSRSSRRRGAARPSSMYSLAWRPNSVPSTHRHTEHVPGGDVGDGLVTRQAERTAFLAGSCRPRSTSRAPGIIAE